MPTINIGRVRPNWVGEWSALTTYAILDAVSYQGGSYIMKSLALAGTVPTTTASWMKLAGVGGQGPQGPQGEAGSIVGYENLSWVSLVVGYKTEPTLNSTIASGDVWNYVYATSGTDLTYYRLVPSGSADDAFYTTFSAGVLSGLVSKKPVVL